MNITYFTVYNGYYLSRISLSKGEIEYSINEDCRLWFSEKDADIVEEFLNVNLKDLYFRVKDKEFPLLLAELKEKGIIDEEYIRECYRNWSTQ